MTLLLEDKSDNLISMKRIMTATEVARNFSDVLDAVVNGDEITITRGNKPIAVLGSVKEKIPNSVLLAEALEKHFEKFGPLPEEVGEARKKLIRESRDQDLELVLAQERERWGSLQEPLNKPEGYERGPWTE